MTESEMNTLSGIVAASTIQPGAGAEKIRAIALLLLIIPITVFANFLRVTSLVLIAYYGGVDRMEGPLHDLTGVALFVVAVVLMFLADGAISLLMKLFGRRSTRLVTP
ncbi:MAG: archaeosortase/exosortase family protein [Bradyrhizobium sp.]|nr:archaeosortase/exosortase family protein [Bradyrhizobium sp.]